METNLNQPLPTLKEVMARVIGPEIKRLREEVDAREAALHSVVDTLGPRLEFFRNEMRRREEALSDVCAAIGLDVGELYSATSIRRHFLIEQHLAGLAREAVEEE